MSIEMLVASSRLYVVPLTRSAGANISSPVARGGYGEFRLCKHLKDFFLIHTSELADIPVFPASPVPSNFLARLFLRI